MHANKYSADRLLTLIAGTLKVSREEFKRQKELDAARKAGTAPAELDEQGKAINPHIPRNSPPLSTKDTPLTLQQNISRKLLGTWIPVVPLLPIKGE
jgi:hypothetical protein